MATVQPAWRRKHSKTVKDHCPNSDSYRGSYFSNDWVSVFHFGLPLLCAAAVPLLCRCCLVSPPVSLHVSPRALHTIYGNSLFLPWNVANPHQRLRHAPLALYLPNGMVVYWATFSPKEFQFWFVRRGKFQTFISSPELSPRLYADLARAITAKNGEPGSRLLPIA